MLTVSCNLSNILLKMKNWMVVRAQNGSKCMGCLLSLCGYPDAGAGCHCPASQESIKTCITRLGKDQISKFEVWFLLNTYCFYIIVKSKNQKLNNCKSEIICIYYSVKSLGMQQEIKAPSRRERQEEKKCAF